MQTRYLSIDYDGREEYSPHDEDDRTEYVCRESHYDLWSVNGYTCVSKDSYFDVTCDVVPTQGQRVFLVLVRYRSGDSFTRNTGQVALVAAYANHEDAMRVVRAIEDRGSEHDFTSKDGQYCTVTLQSGVQERIECSRWTGYFERIESADIYEIGPL